MKKISTLFVALGIAAASLSSCSRSNYAFNTPAQQGSEKVQAPAEKATAIETKNSSLYEAATVVAPRQVSAPAPEVAKPAVATTHPVTPAIQPATATTPEALATNEAPSTKAKPSLMQRVVLNSLTKKLDKIKQKQATANTTTDRSLLHTALFVGLGGILAVIIGILIAGGSISGGSGAGFTIGVVLVYLGQIAFLVGLILAIVALVKS